MSRRLVSIRRSVAGSRAADYDALWSAVRQRVEAAGAHAWRFAAADDGTRRMEFIEFRAGADPRRGPEVRAALDRLEGAFPGEEEEWDDV